MDDAARTAHSSTGSDTKLVLEDSTELVRGIGQRPSDLRIVLEHYEAVRSTEVLRTQSAARDSTEQFENVVRYANLPTEQLTYPLLMRGQRIGHENLCQRDKHYLEQLEDWIAEQAGAQRGSQHDPVPPVFTSFTVRGVMLKNRVVVSPAAQYSYKDGQPTDYHLVCLGVCVMGGIGLVTAEMTCVSPDTRTTPGCPGSWSTDQCGGQARIIQSAHANSDMRPDIQFDYVGAKGLTRVAWGGIDLPLEGGQNWPLISVSPQQYLDGVGQRSRAMIRDDMDRVRDDFIHSVRLVAEVGSDWLELHYAYGYLLLSFTSPLTNQCNDGCGDSLKNWLRSPLEVFHIVCEVWPSNKPVSVRISAHGWVEGGITPGDVAEIARVFRATGIDMVDCSLGQISKKEQSVYGHTFRMPFVDRVCSEAGTATITVGTISETDHVNGIITACCADLCAVVCPHLANPA